MRNWGRSNVVLRPVGVVVMLSTVVGLCAAAWGISGDEIIAKVREAHRTAAYEGVRVVELWSPHGKIVIKQKALFGGDGRQRFEVISPAKFAGDLVVCDGQKQWRYVPREKTAYLLPPIPPPYGVGLGCGAERRRHGQMTGRRMCGPRWQLLGQEEVAGRKCFVLGLVSHRGRQVAKLWVDAERFVVLGGEFGSPGAPRGKRWKFETVKFDVKVAPGTFDFRPPPGTRVVRRVPAARRMPLAQAEAATGMKAIIPGKLPEGYFLLKDQVGVIERGGRKVLWMVFTNGADTFSIFQSRRLPGRLKLPRGAVARWDVGPYSLIVVGRVSRDALELMRESLPRAQGPGLVRPRRGR